MAVELCDAAYERLPGRILFCQYVQGHTADHSWRTAKLEDEQELLRTSQYATQIGALLEAIARGDCDLYLEALLAGCHERKRARRGVWAPR